ncbi:MAG: TonB-dependent receptor, partial [Oricola sp.]|nr:TonB-dependent receptor [Oricola sp.]
DINNQETRFNRNEFGSDRAIASPVDRLTFATRASYEVDEKLTLILDGNYGKVSSLSIYEPHPLIANSNIIGVGANINVENWLTNPADGTTVLVRNPFIPDLIYNNATDTNNDGLRDIGFSKRMVEFGNRSTDIDRELFRIALGAEGNLTDNWSYDLYYTYGRTSLSGRMGGLYIQSNLLNSFTAGTDYFDFDGDGNTSEAICVDNTARRQYGCAPADVFGVGRMSQEAIDYVSGAATQESTQTMQVVSGNISGSLFELPAGPVQLAAGLEYREEKSAHLFDPLSNKHQNGYVQQNNTVGSFDVKEAYAEINIPVLEGRPMFESLSLRGAARISDYSTVGAFWAYNGGVEWRPVPDLRIRGVYAHAVRAPNIGELYRAASAGITAIVDPCNGISTSDTSAVAQNCLADPGVAANAAANGGTVTLIQSDFQGVPQIDTPNPNIREETATTWTLGAVYSPEALSGFVFTV